MTDLKELSKNIRLKTLEMINKTHASHIASAFSMVEILACLYGRVMNVNPSNIGDASRDKFVLSKGHGASSVYATLYLCGFLTKEEIDNYYADGSCLSGHVSKKGVSGIEFSTGSLGHGVCVACGFALASRLDGIENKTYVIVGDGECNEGCVWETATFAAQQKLRNLVVIVDKNGMQAMGKTAEIADMGDLAQKWSDFGFYTQTVNGHDTDELLAAFKNCENSDRPCCIVANTIKGKGVSYMENEILWHYRDPQGELFEKAREELINEK